MRLIKDVGQRDSGRTFSGEVVVDGSVCYDFVVSLRALFNPRTFTRTRRWSASQLPQLPAALLPKAKFLFQGFDTSLGYGATRLIGRLPPGAKPADLIRAVGQSPSAELALFMLDTGETSQDRLDLYRAVLMGDDSQTTRALAGLPAGWATRCRQVLQDPDQARSDLVDVLSAYLDRIYSHHLESVQGRITAAVPVAEKILGILPPSAAIEQLTGGYTIGADLGLNKITMAPSVFIHPYMSTRLDESTGEALVIYGLPSDIFDAYDPVPVRHELIAALKAMADPNRLALLEILSGDEVYATELTSRLGLAQPTVHHHLAQLRTAGLIRQERDRHGMKYSIRHDSADAVLRSLRDLLGSPPTT
ncbi:MULTISPECIES: ArsR/SmtB family transcription factor [unclassified Kribbella]|uniref:ArsR/SmtB family transcription factor n=1 Tax=unclassified Kribbella TaxID=2644121 RepID=UPI003016D4F0